MPEQSPLAAAIDRELTARFGEKTWSGVPMQVVRDAIVAEIEAEFGPLTVERRWPIPLGASGPGPEPIETRLVSEWRAES